MLAAFMRLAHGSPTFGAASARFERQRSHQRPVCPWHLCVGAQVQSEARRGWGLASSPRLPPPVPPVPRLRRNPEWARGFRGIVQRVGQRFHLALLRATEGCAHHLAFEPGSFRNVQRAPPNRRHPLPLSAGPPAAVRVSGSFLQFAPKVQTSGAPHRRCGFRSCMRRSRPD